MDRLFEDRYCSLPSHWSLAPRYAGQEQCSPCQRWSGVRDHYLLHYIQSGEGTVRSGSRRYRAAAGSAFLYAPDEFMDYEADRNHPWLYIWTGFSGTAASELVESIGVHPGRPTITLSSPNNVAELITSLKNSLRESATSSGARSAGWLHLLLAELAGARADATGNPTASRVGTDSLVRQARLFIESNFQRSIGVADVVNYIGLDRSYLGKRFKEETGRTMQDYLTNRRMLRARELVRQTRISVASIASSVGYRSYEVFERTYRATFGEAPRVTRRRDTPEEVA